MMKSVNLIFSWERKLLGFFFRYARLSLFAPFIATPIWGKNPTTFGAIVDRSVGPARGFILYKNESVGRVFYDIGPSAGGVMHYKDWQHTVLEIFISS